MRWFEEEREREYIDRNKEYSNTLTNRESYKLREARRGQMKIEGNRE